MHRVKGKIISWQPDKGYGFLASMDGSKQVFIHRSALQNKQRQPQVNDIITYRPATDKHGRDCASEARFSGEKALPARLPASGSWALRLATLFVVGLTLLWLAGHISAALLYVYVGSSVASVLAYALDKFKARRGSWRISEASLHGLALVGGWPGAALAQRWFRHKTAKRAFQQLYWLTCVTNLALLTAWLYYR